MSTSEVLYSVIAFTLGGTFGLFIFFSKYRGLHKQFLQSIHTYQGAMSLHKDGLKELHKQNAGLLTEVKRLKIELDFRTGFANDVSGYARGLRQANDELGNEIMKLNKELGDEKARNKELETLVLECDTVMLQGIAHGYTVLTTKTWDKRLKEALEAKNKLKK
jgi:predicted RNase H-like nuclease (RuvC/YqgF family)